MSDVLKSVGKRFLMVAIVVFVMMQIIALMCIDWFMFHPEMITEKYDESAEGYVNIGTREDPIAAVILGPELGKKAILRCHGNAESMYQSVAILRDLVERGYTVACVDYPGYGLSAGSPTEEGCYRNVHRLYDYLVKKRGFSPKDIVIDGFSIGSGPAVELASTKEVGGLVLEAPFLSAPRVLTQMRMLVVDPFPNASRIADLKCPLLILHGTDDTVIPFRHGEKLFRISQSSEFPRRFIPVEGADHAEIPDVLGIHNYLNTIADFADSVNPYDGRWRGMSRINEWADCVKTNTALPTVWKYYDERFRPYVRRALAMPSEGPFAKEMEELADAVADSLYDGGRDCMLIRGLEYPGDLARKLLAVGCSNLTVRALALIRDDSDWCKSNVNGRATPIELYDRLLGMGRELCGGSALMLHLFAAATGGQDKAVEFADQVLLDDAKSHPEDLRSLRMIIGCPSAARQPGVDPWFALLADAENERRAAWDARGSGFANTVSEEGWRLFDDHLAKAKSFALKAHELHPEFPDAAALLLQIVSPICDQAEKDHWFAEVLTREVDHNEAWGTYEFYLRPRWGGSIGALQKISDAQWRTQRFDTRLPYLAAAMLYAIDEEQRLAGERKFQKRIFADPAMQDRFVAGMENFVARCKIRRANGEARMDLVDMFWKVGNWKEAAKRKRELLDGFARPYADEWYQFGETMELVMSAIGGPHTDELIALEKYCQRKLDNKQTVSDAVRSRAAELLKPLASNLSELTPAELKVVKRRMPQILPPEPDEDGWVELSLAEGLPGWEAFPMNCWTLGKGYVESRFGTLESKGSLPADYEVEVTFETGVTMYLTLDDKCLGEEGDGIGIGRPSVTVHMRWTKAEGDVPWLLVHSAFWNGKQDRDGNDYGDPIEQKLDKGNGTRHILHAIVKGQRLTVSFDGKLVVDDSDRLARHFSAKRKGCGFTIGGRRLKLFKVRYRKIPNETDA